MMNGSAGSEGVDVSHATYAVGSSLTLSETGDRSRSESREQGGSLRFSGNSEELRAQRRMSESEAAEAGVACKCGDSRRLERAKGSRSRGSDPTDFATPRSVSTGTASVWCVPGGVWRALGDAVTSATRLSAMPACACLLGGHSGSGGHMSIQSIRGAQRAGITAIGIRAGACSASLSHLLLSPLSVDKALARFFFFPPRSVPVAFPLLTQIPSFLAITTLFDPAPGVPPSPPPTFHHAVHRSRSAGGGHHG